MRFLIDMNLSPLWVPFLASHGLEAVHWSAVGNASAPDSEIMQYAADGGYIVLTPDLDFGMLLASSGTSRPSVVQLRCQDVLPSAIGGAVLSAVAATRRHLETGALVPIDPVRHRIRLLPI
jgi:predicted nuclease of predicted toxin-antitoxin system